MRESLGWLSNCGDESTCRQNWLERAVSEVPTTVQCCGNEVHLVLSLEEFEQKTQQSLTSAVPIVPCAGQPAIHSALSAEQASASQPDSGYSEPPPPRRMPKATTAPPAIEPEHITNLYCILSNGDRIKCDKESMVIGRSRTCDIILPSAKVSRQHASIFQRNGKWHIEDMGSANGVWINGQRIAEATVIRDEDVYTISDETLTFQFR